MSPNHSASLFLNRVRGPIRVRHYSIRTEESYISWIKQFILFHNKGQPAEMGEQESFRPDRACPVSNVYNAAEPKIFRADETVRTG